MRQKLSKPSRNLIVGAICVALFTLAALYVVRSIYLAQTSSQRKEIAKEKRVEEVWQEYDPNEDELWHIVSTTNHMPRKMRYLAAHALIEETSLEKRLVYLLGHSYSQEKIRVEASDKLFLQNPSIETLKEIIRRVPERAELAVQTLTSQTNDPNVIGFNCFLNIVVNAPSYRKWAWKNILSKPEWITEDIQWCFAKDPDFPDEAVDIYFKLDDLQPENYRWVMSEALQENHRLRAWKEFKLTKPHNKEMVKILSWADAYLPEIFIMAGKYILDNNPAEEDIIWVEAECPDLKRDCQKAKKELFEREEKRQKTKKVLLEELKDLLY